MQPIFVLAFPPLLYYKRNVRKYSQAKSYSLLALDLRQLSAGAEFQGALCIPAGIIAPPPCCFPSHVLLCDAQTVEVRGTLIY